MSKEQQAQAQPQVAIPLPKAKKNLVQIGCICMMLSVAMYGLVFATLTAPILEKVDSWNYLCTCRFCICICEISDSTDDPQTDCQPCTGRIYSSTIHYRRSYQ